MLTAVKKFSGKAFPEELFACLSSQQLQKKSFQIADLEG
jgi:hypothetical protein